MEDEEYAGQIIPKREWYFQFKIQEAGGDRSDSWQVIKADTAMEANKILRDYIDRQYPKNRGFCVFSMNRV